ncbi:MAG: hypothetical protein IJU77_08990 [Butyrivibrio sp.]|nr:hypothetical protein [Butyrivibrio sp.]
MQEDFHYYATYCAAYLAGFSHEESLDICYCAQLVDLCSRTFLTRLKAPLNAATTQLNLEMMDARTDIIGLQDITRIWASFHFLPADLYARKKWRPRIYMNKYRLICGPNGDLLEKTVRLAKGKNIQHFGLAMHVLADTWAHSGFAGTPSLVINNTDRDFFEYVEKDGEEIKRRVKFRHSTSTPDDIEKGIYTNSLSQANEHSIMNLGHGRAGHFPDYSFAHYEYVPAWDDYKIREKNNPKDYEKAFCQMVYALKYLRGEYDAFEKDTYDTNVMEKHGERIRAIIRKRQINASEDWKQFGEELSGKTVEDFEIDKHFDEYDLVPDGMKDDTFLGKFFNAALSQKGMVSEEIFKSGNLLAGISVSILGDK